MEMKNMKTKPMKSANALYETSKNSPKYPYGLQINLEKEQLDKLGVSDLPEVGTSGMIMAKCDIIRSAETETQDGHNSKTLTLQITDMNFSYKEKSLYEDEE